jgi:GntR family transcriptional regulator
LLTFNLQPIVLEDIWVPASLFGELTAELLAQWKGPMYALFESEFQVHMVRASEKIKAIKADKLANEYLDLEIGSPVLSVNRVSYTYEDRPVEVRQAIYATENHHYSSELS